MPVRKEKWCDVIGFEGLYQVSDQGNVRRRIGIGFHELSLWMDKQGFWTCRPSKEGKAGIKMVHRLMYESFVGPIPKGFNVIHRNGDKTKNCIKNFILKPCISAVLIGAKRGGDARK